MTSKIKRHHFAGLSLLALAIAGQAQAQTVAPAEPAPAAEVENQGEALEDLVVTAQRREERLQDVPLAISAFSPQELQKLPVFSAPHLGHFQLLTTGFFSPQALQKLPVLVAPHLGHTQLSAAGCAGACPAVPYT